MVYDLIPLYIYICIIYIIMLYQQRGCPGIQERCVERRATAMYDMERVPSKMEVDMHTHMQYIYIYMQGHTRISYNMHVHDCALVSKSGLIGLIGFWSDAWSTIFMTQGSCFFCRGDLGKTWIYHGYDMDEPFWAATNHSRLWILYPLGI